MNFLVYIQFMSSCFRWGCCSDDGLVPFWILTPRMITRYKNGDGHCLNILDCRSVASLN